MLPSEKYPKYLKNERNRFDSVTLERKRLKKKEILSCRGDIIARNLFLENLDKNSAKEV